MGHNKAILILLGMVVIASSFTALFILIPYSSPVLETKIINIDLIVGSNVGFNMAKDALHLGKTSPGGSASRVANITHSYPSEVQVTLQVEGNLSQWVSFSENDIALAPAQIRPIRIQANVPLTAPYGNYSGMVTITFTKP